MSVAVRDVQLQVLDGTDVGIYSRRLVAIDQNGHRWDRNVPEPIEEVTLPLPTDAWYVGAPRLEIRSDGSGDYLDLEDFMDDPTYVGVDVVLLVDPSLPVTTGKPGTNTGGTLIADDRRGGAWTAVESSLLFLLPARSTTAVGTLPTLSSRVNETHLADMGEIRRQPSVNPCLRVAPTAQRWWFRGIRFTDVAAPVQQTGWFPIAVWGEPDADDSQIAEDIHLSQCTVEGWGPRGTAPNGTDIASTHDKFCNGILLSGNNVSVTDSSVWGVDQVGRETHSIFWPKGNRWLCRNTHTNGGSIGIFVGYNSPNVPGLTPRNYRIEFCDVYRPSNYKYHVLKGGIESKDSYLGIIQGNVIRGGFWESGDSDRANMIAIGMKNTASGNPTGSGPNGTCCITIRHNLVYDYMQVGYQIMAGISAPHVGTHGIIWHDFWAHKLGAEAASYAATAMPVSAVDPFNFFDGTNTFGYRGPSFSGFEGNTILAGATMMSNAMQGSANGDWNQDGAAATCSVCDNIWSWTQYGIFMQDGGGEGGAGAGQSWAELGSYEYNVIPDAPAGNYPAHGRNWRPPLQGTFVSTYLDADHRPNAAFITDMRAAIGQNQIATERTYRRPDGTTFVRTVPGADIDGLLAIFGDKWGANVISPTTVEFAA